MFIYYRVAHWHAPEEDRQPPKTNSPNDFKREALVKVLNNHSSSAVGLVQHLSSMYIDMIFLAGEPHLISLGQLLFFPVAFT